MNYVLTSDTVTLLIIAAEDYVQSGPEKKSSAVKRCHVHMQGDVAHNIYPIPAV